MSKEQTEQVVREWRLVPEYPYEVSNFGEVQD